MSPFGIFGLGAFGLLVVLWLVISFTAPSPRRETLEWLAACCLYGAIGSIFANLFHESWIAEGAVELFDGAVKAPRIPCLLGFGLLLLIFGSGFFVSLATTIRSIGGGPKAQSSATN